MNVIDLRSDTVTRPTAAMRAAMLDAKLGDDVYGEDPTLNALQQRLAGRCRLVRAQRNPVQPAGPAGALRARRRIPGGHGCTHLQGRRWWRGGAWLDPAAAHRAGRLRGIAGIDVLGQHANMVFINVPAECLRALDAHLGEAGIRIRIGYLPTVRLVTHLDVDDDGIERTTDALANFFDKR